MQNEMTAIGPGDISKMDRIHRINLVNKLSGIKGANLIGTVDKDGQTNLALFNSVIHIGSRPPCMGFMLRPTIVPRHTYNNIIETGHFTINAVTREMIERAHRTSAKFPEGESEFEACGFEADFKNFPAPFVAESPLQIGLSFLEEHMVSFNQTRLIVGKVHNIFLPAAALDSEQHFDLDQLDLIGVSGLETYYGLSKISRQPYARVKNNRSAL